MGKFKFGVEEVFKGKLLMAHYSFLDNEAKDLIDETVKKSLKPNPVLRIKTITGFNFLNPKQDNLWNLSWSDIVELRHLITEKCLFDVLKLMYGIKEKQFARLPIFNTFSTYKWIVERLEEMAVIEQQELGSEITAEEKEAGAEQLQEFGYSFSVDGLAHGDILKYNDIMQQNYAVIFRKMCLDKVSSEVKNQYQENASRKTQRGS